MKKFIALLLVAVMCFSLGIGGTVAYLTDRETETNVFTVGNVDIELTEDFVQGSKLLPGTVIDKNVSIKNVGTNDAWVFYTYVIPQEIDKENVVKVSFEDTTNWTAKQEVFKETIDNVIYNVHVVAYNEALEPNTETSVSLTSVELSSAIDSVDGVWATVVDGAVTKTGWPADKAPIVYVAAYAIQKEEFANVEAAIDAYTTQWKGLNAEYVTPVVVDTVEEFTEVLKSAAAPKSGNTSIVLTSDLDMSEVDWTPIKVEGYQGAGVVTIDGGYNTITGLDAPLFAGGFAGKSGIVIKNLTIANSNIVSTSGLGGGAFVDTADSMQVVTLENCHLVNSTVSGERAGGLVGWVSGYANLSDGPVKTYVTIKDCSVKGSTINGNGSVGGIVGHPGASDYTYTTIENCTVLNNILASTDDGDWRVGAIVGTANNGHVVINNCTIGGNTLTQTPGGDKNGADTTYPGVEVGRFVPGATGTLEINGVSEVAVVSTAGDLKDAINAGGTILLNDKVAAEDLTYVGAEATEDITVVGGTISRDTASGNPLLVNTTNKVTFEDVTFESVKGNAVLASRKEGANIEVNNCVFTNKAAPSTGNTGIQVYASNTTWVFNNCTFNNMPIETNSSYPKGIKLVFNNCTFTWTGDNCPGMIKLANYVEADIDINNCKFVYTTNSQYTTAKNMISYYSGVGSTTIDINGLEVIGTRNNDKIWKICSTSNNVTINTTGTLSYTFNGEAVDFNTYLK